jgi:hypothetical protein
MSARALARRKSIQRIASSLLGPGFRLSWLGA